MDKLVKGSPFSSYTQAALAMGNINISSVISKKNRYRKVVQTKIYIWIFCLIWYLITRFTHLYLQEVSLYVLPC